MRRITHVLAVFLLLLGAATGFAQTYTGTVAGTVNDEQGGVLPGATVTLAGKTGSRSSVTDAKGEYRFTAVDPGTYDITVEMQGFRPKKLESVVVTIGKTAEAAFTMKVGGLTD